MYKICLGYNFSGGPFLECIPNISPHGIENQKVFSQEERDRELSSKVPSTSEI